MRSRVRKLEARIGATFTSIGNWRIETNDDGNLTISELDGDTAILASTDPDNYPPMYAATSDFDDHLDTTDDDHIPHTQHPHRSEIGAANGVAPLDENSSVPREHLNSTAAEPESIWALLKYRQPVLHAQPREPSFTVDERLAFSSANWPNQPAAAYWVDADQNTWMYAADTTGLILRANVDPTGLDPDDTTNLVTCTTVDQPADTTILSIAHPLDIRSLDIGDLEAVTVLQLESTTSPGYGWHELATTDDDGITWTCLGSVFEPQLDSGDIDDSDLGNAVPGVGQLNVADFDGTDMIFSTCVDVAANGTSTNLSLYGMDWNDFLDDLEAATLPEFAKWDGTAFTGDYATGLATELAAVTVGTYQDHIERLGMGQKSDLLWVPEIKRWVLVWANAINFESQLWAAVSTDPTPTAWADPTPLLPETVTVPEEYIYPWVYSGNRDAPKDISYDGMTVNYLTQNADRWATAVWNTARIKPSIPERIGVTIWPVDAVGRATAGTTGVGPLLEQFNAIRNERIRNVVPGDRVLVISDPITSNPTGIYTIPFDGGDWIYDNPQPADNDFIQNTFDGYSYATLDTLWRKSTVASTTTWAPLNFGWNAVMLDRWFNNIGAPTVLPAGQATLATTQRDPDPATLAPATLPASTITGTLLQLDSSTIFSKVSFFTDGSVASEATIVVYLNKYGYPEGYPIHMWDEIDCTAAGWIEHTFPTPIILPAGDYQVGIITDVNRDIHTHTADTVAAPSPDLSTGDIRIGWSVTADLAEYINYTVQTINPVNDGDPLPALWWTIADPL